MLARLYRMTLMLAAMLQGVVPRFAAAQAKPLTLEYIVQSRRGAVQAALSPDGHWVAVTANGPRGFGLYRLATGGGEPPTADFWAAGRSPTWFPDSRSIVFLRDNDLWRIGLHDGDPRRLTRDEGDERAPRVSPDGRGIVYYSSRSGHQDLWVIETPDGQPRQLTRAAYARDDARWAPAWSPDSRHVAYISNRSDYWHDDVWVVNVESGQARQVSTGLMASSTPAWSPSGRRLALLGTSKSGYWYEDLADIYLLDPSAGTEETVDMQVYATDWLHSMPIIWSGDERELFFTYQQRADFDLWRVSAMGGVATRVTNAGGALSSVSASAAADAFAFIRHTPTRGPEVDYITKVGGALRRLTSFTDEWTPVIEPEEVSYRSFDGLYVQGFLFLPPGAARGDGGSGRRYPALVQVHGGGTNSYLRGQSLLEQYLATQGYVVLAVNYRGGSGFGREFQNLSVNRWASEQARDAAAAAAFLRAQPYANGRVGIYGYSYGGIQTMAAIARVPDAFDAAVAMAGIYDFGDAYTNADRIGKIFIKTGHGGSPEERPEVYAVSNTLARLGSIVTPLLIMHGESDVRAPYRQYELALAELRKHGKKFESKSFPGEGHGMTQASRLELYQRLEAFFEEHLR